MGREVHRLSAKTLEKTMPPGYYCDGGGLYLQVSPTQSQSWIFRYKRQGRSREMGLGSARDVSLAQARAKAS
ncbi:MAG TPA: Arm DNA-binding domain-containing protein, partial [Burkholderiales bacterium]|nr:Arm DNA-binding domain-containing protein [Burkholderiales bacterium]